MNTCSCGSVSLYPGQKPTTLGGMTHARDGCFSPVGATYVQCDHGERFWVLGETPEKRARAVAEWPGCGCAEEGAA